MAPKEEIALKPLSMQELYCVLTMLSIFDILAPFIATAIYSVLFKQTFHGDVEFKPPATHVVCLLFISKPLLSCNVLVESP